MFSTIKISVFIAVILRFTATGGYVRWPTVVLKKEERLFSALSSTDVEYDLIVTGVHLILDEFTLAQPLVELSLDLGQLCLRCIDNDDVNTIVVFVCHGFFC